MISRSRGVRASFPAEALSLRRALQGGERLKALPCVPAALLSAWRGPTGTWEAERGEGTAGCCCPPELHVLPGTAFCQDSAWRPAGR